MVLVKPATVVQWHRGISVVLAFATEVSRFGTAQDVLGHPRFNPSMCRANPLWGAPRVHGELLKLGIEISQATVGRYMPWRPQRPLLRLAYVRPRIGFSK